jgi:predicted ATPase/class 3 adenylate cyclase
MREKLPAGTVTFLFTDIEGSTALLHELGPERYAEALARHRRVVRDAIAAHGGVEVDTQGDAFFAAFPTAPGAVGAADAIAQALANSATRLRMGVHSGTPTLTDEGYVGVDVHRAARIAACGHGGQILISATTASLVDGAALLDLGEHRLKDLASAERIYQLGDTEFPPLRTLYRTNLPVPATPFLGRARELNELSELLASPAIRLLTLTGPGGTGKTRLAMQAVAGAGDRFPHGVFWVPLAALTDPGLVLGSAASALGILGDLADHIRDRALLLLLDNFEHVVSAAGDIQVLLAACPNLRIVVTSRELLRVPGERAYNVHALDASDSVELFISRALDLGVSIEATPEVTELCDRLEHLPLALELAAGRLGVLPPAKLLERLSGRLDLLRAGRGVDARQQTLRATIEWSYDLLPPEEQAVFARLGAFPGGCTLETAEDVIHADLDVLQALVDKSLIRVRDGQRFWMLELIREYSVEKLDESGEAEDVRRRHADHFLELAERAEPYLVTDLANDWLECLEREHDNLRAALEEYALADEGEHLQRLVGSLGTFWELKGPVGEGVAWADRALSLADRPTSARAAALRTAASLAALSGDAREGARLAGLSRDLYEAVGNELGLAAASWMQGYALAELGDLAAAERLLGDAVRGFESLGADHAAIWARRSLAFACLAQGKAELGRAVHEQNLERARALGNRRAEATILGALALLAANEGRIDDALDLLIENMPIFLELADVLVALESNLSRAASVLALAGDHATATKLLAHTARVRDELGVQQPWVTRNDEETRETIVSGLDESSFAFAWAAGTKLTPAEAASLALDAMADARA